MQWHFSMCVVFFVYTITGYRKRRCNPNKQGRLAHSIFVAYYISKTSGPFRFRESREKTYSVGERYLKHSIFWGVGPCRLVGTTVTSTVLA